MNFTYEVDKGGHKFELETTWDKDNPEYIAEDAAKDYYENRDGWESSWPVNIDVFCDDELIGNHTVELEHEPTFSAT